MILGKNNDTKATERPSTRVTLQYAFFHLRPVNLFQDVTPISNFKLLTSNFERGARIVPVCRVFLQDRVPMPF